MLRDEILIKPAENQIAVDWRLKCTIILFCYAKASKDVTILAEEEDFGSGSIQFPKNNEATKFIMISVWSEAGFCSKKIMSEAYAFYHF